MCYQLPAILQRGVTLVISPLIALMKNQVDYLHSVGIHAAFFNSTLSKKEADKIRKEVLTEKIKLLYIAPESLIKGEVLDFLRHTHLAFVAIDEAHCISEWGHDFRPEYRNIKTVIQKELGNLPVIGLTATATPRVHLDILKNLEMEKVKTFKSSFDRKNLFYKVQLKTADVDKDLIKFLKKKDRGAGIIYCQSRKTVEETTQLLQVNGISSAPYHAGLEGNVRVKNQDAFLRDDVQVIVATIAFGMGIDKSNVRFIVHYDMPRSIEAYYQETGRSGRDGLPSTCLLFYSPQDVEKMDKLNQSKSPTEREKAYLLLHEITAYITAGVCRRRSLLFYFGEKYTKDCGQCDNCSEPTETYDGTTLAVEVLQSALQKQGCTLSEHIAHLVHNFVPKPNSPEWESVIRQLLLQGLLQRDIEQGNTIQVTAEGKAFLQKQYPIPFQQDHNYAEAYAASQQKKGNSPSPIQGVDKVLLKNLRNIRAATAQEKGVPEYAVLQDSSLEEMALVYPTSLEALEKIHGLHAGKAKRFGLPFIQFIQQYVESNDIEPISDILIRSVAKKSKNKIFIIQQIDRKIDLEEIATSRSLNMEELIQEMEKICYAGVKLNLDYYIDTILTQEQKEEIYSYFMQATTDNISQARKILGERFDKEELQLIRIKFLSEVAN